MAVPLASAHRTPAVLTQSTADRPACPLCHKPMVVRKARRGRSAGISFWGCTTFPACRGARALSRPRADVAVAESSHHPGELSARVTYERRLARHRAKVRTHRTRTLLLGGSAVVVATVLGLLLYPGLRTVAFLAWAIAASAVVWTMGELWAIPADISAWKTGADGEDRTARALAELESEGFIVLHDRRKPGSSANIDHVIVGPTGVFVVETKSYSGPLSIRGDDVFVGGRRRTDMVQQARSEADVVKAVLAIAGDNLPVTPILCIHRAEMPLLKASVQGIPVVNERGLVRVLRRTADVLDPQKVLEVAALLNRELRPAA
jgi:ssDNA-binding Zn-finger/Zn-ribbon topoisomerase 1